MKEESLRKEIARAELPASLKAYLLFKLGEMTDEQKQQLSELISGEAAEIKEA